MDEEKFYDIYGYFYRPFWQTHIFKMIIITLCALVVLFCSYMLILYLKKRKNKITTLSSWEWALKELNQLSLKKQFNKNEYKHFYFELTKIVKKYLYKRYKWNVKDKTDDELIIFLQEKSFDQILLNNLQEILHGALLIKFADETTLQSQIEKDLKLIIEFIKKTIPIQQ